MCRICELLFASTSQSRHSKWPLLILIPPVRISFEWVCCVCGWSWILYCFSAHMCSARAIVAHHFKHTFASDLHNSMTKYYASLDADCIIFAFNGIRFRFVFAIKGVSVMFRDTFGTNSLSLLPPGVYVNCDVRHVHIKMHKDSFRVLNRCEYVCSVCNSISRRDTKQKNEREEENARICFDPNENLDVRR